MCIVCMELYHVFKLCLKVFEFDFFKKKSNKNLKIWIRTHTQEIGKRFWKFQNWDWDIH